MKDEQHSEAEGRKRRVQRLKKIILISLAVGLTVPWVLCGCLFVSLGGIRRRMEDGKKENAAQAKQIQEMQDQLREQAQQIARLTELLREISDQASAEAAAQSESAQVQAQETSGSAEAAQETGREAAHRVYLTFDDGPSSGTNEILDILDTYGVKATFFVLGKDGEGNREALKRIVESGHSLGMHSYSHRYEEIYASRENFAADLQKLQDYLYEVTGVKSMLYRFPGGSSNSVTNVDIHECISCLEEQGIVYFDWNVSSGDAAAELLSAQTIYTNSISAVDQKPVSVILFHDAANRRTTVEALPAVIEAILAMEDTQILPLTPETEPIQHVKSNHS